MKQIDNWNLVTCKLARKWILKYFKVKGGFDVEYWWVSGEIGTILFVNDYFINFNDIVYCIHHNVKRKKFFKWYETCLDNGMTGTPTESLESYITPKSTVKDKENMDALCSRVKSSNIILHEAIESHNAAVNQNNIEFAKFHVNAAMNAIYSQNEELLDMSFINSAYPLENIR